MSEPTNKTTPPPPSGEVWPEISRLREKIASLELQLTLKNQLPSEETAGEVKEVDRLTARTDDQFVDANKMVPDQLRDATKMVSDTAIK